MKNINNQDLKSAIVDIFKEADNNEKLIKKILWFIIEERRLRHRVYLLSTKANYSDAIKNSIRKEFIESKYICKSIIDFYRSKGH